MAMFSQIFSMCLRLLGFRPQTPTGALPLNPARGLPSHRPLFCLPLANSWLRPWFRRYCLNATRTEEQTAAPKNTARLKGSNFKVRLQYSRHNRFSTLFVDVRKRQRRFSVQSQRLRPQPLNVHRMRLFQHLYKQID